MSLRDFREFHDGNSGARARRMRIAARVNMVVCWGFMITVGYVVAHFVFKYW